MKLIIIIIHVNCSEILIIIKGFFNNLLIEWKYTEKEYVGRNVMYVRNYFNGSPENISWILKYSIFNGC